MGREVEGDCPLERMANRSDDRKCVCVDTQSCVVSDGRMFAPCQGATNLESVFAILMTKPDHAVIATPHQQGLQAVPGCLGDMDEESFFVGENHDGEGIQTPLSVEGAS